MAIDIYKNVNFLQGISGFSSSMSVSVGNITRNEDTITLSEVQAYGSVTSTHTAGTFFVRLFFGVVPNDHPSGLRDMDPGWYGDSASFSGAATFNVTIPFPSLTFSVGKYQTSSFLWGVGSINGSFSGTGYPYAPTKTITYPRNHPLYGSVNGKSKAIKTLYCSVNGKSKKLLKLYGSVNGKSKRIY